MTKKFKPLKEKLTELEMLVHDCTFDIHHTRCEHCGDINTAYVDLLTNLELLNGLKTAIRGDFQDVETKP